MERSVAKLPRNMPVQFIRARYLCILSQSCATFCSTSRVATASPCHHSNLQTIFCHHISTLSPHSVGAATRDQMHASNGMCVCVFARLISCAPFPSTIFLTHLSTIHTRAQQCPFSGHTEIERKKHTLPNQLSNLKKQLIHDAIGQRSLTSAHCWPARYHTSSSRTERWPLESVA